MERRKFEDSFKEAFKEAEVSPREEVWTNIELELEKASGEKTRRKLAFYKLLAAASVVFALSVTGIGYYLLSHNSQYVQEIAGNTASLDKSDPLANRTDDQPSLSQSVTDQPGVKQTPGNETSRKNNVASSRVKAQDGSTLITPTQIDETNAVRNSDEGSGFIAATGENQPGPTILPIPTDIQTNNNGVVASDLNGGQLQGPSIHGERALPQYFKATAPTLTIPDHQPDAVAIMMAKLEDDERKFAAEEGKEKTKNNEKVWTSVGFAAGGFSSVNHSVAPQTTMVTALANTSVPDKQAKANGIAYSMGVSVGTKIAKRWILQGGVNYLTQSSDYTASNVVVTENDYQSLKAESINTLEGLPLVADVASSNKLAATVPYSVNNSVKFFSVPVQAGYLVVNKKFGLQLNAGLSTDLFLQNTITPQGSNLDKSTQGRGDDSPYRSVNFSGLMGTELSYRLGQRYRVALNPGVRYPLSSLYKSDVGIQSTPLTFDVGLRFRYIFQ
ncbi:MAG TPA: outer membrane beta-barrel protein [Chryseolinea sp.]|nr:outer membrane beta-barrel protein [Chryseolinea sp.]